MLNDPTICSKMNVYNCRVEVSYCCKILFCFLHCSCKISLPFFSLIALADTVNTVFNISEDIGQTFFFPDFIFFHDDARCCNKVCGCVHVCVCKIFVWWALLYFSLSELENYVIFITKRKFEYFFFFCDLEQLASDIKVFRNNKLL